MSDPAYEVYALKYAHHDRHSRENFLVEDPHDGPQPLAYYVWVIRNEDRTILVDTGFDEANKQRHRAARAERGYDAKAGSQHITDADPFSAR